MLHGVQVTTQLHNHCIHHYKLLSAYQLNTTSVLFAHEYMSSIVNNRTKKANNKNNGCQMGVR